jgi:CRP/FNR family transcriptional regulator, nitrogen oxide reductase regulator
MQAPLLCLLVSPNMRLKIIDVGMKRDSCVISILANSQIFANLDIRALEIVQQNAHLQRGDSGYFFVQQGKPALFFYLLVRGHAKLSQVTEDGHQVLIRYIGPGEEFGLVAVLSKFDYPATVEAVEACEALVWEGELLAQLIERYPRIGFNGIRILAQQNQKLQRRYQELLTERVEQRLAQSILRLSRQVGHKTLVGALIDIPLSRQDLAELVGTDIYTVSRIMSRWERKEIVRTDRQSVQLLQREALERLARPT